MQELMTLLTAHPALVALPAEPSSARCLACVHLERGCISPAPTLPRAHIIPSLCVLPVEKKAVQFLLFPKKQQLCFQRDGGSAHVSSKRLCCPLMVVSCACGSTEVSPHFLAASRHLEIN